MFFVISTTSSAHNDKDDDVNVGSRRQLEDRRTRNVEPEEASDMKMESIIDLDKGVINYTSIIRSHIIR